MDSIIVAPSGAQFDFRAQTLVWELGEVGFITWSREPFKLKSGIMSHVYVHGRQDLTDHPQILKHLGQAIAKSIRAGAIARNGNMPCLIGVPMAGNALAQAAAFMSSDTMCFRVMRPVKKSHGVNQTWVDGEPDPGRHEYIGIEGVVTSGASVIEAAGRLQEDGYPRDMTFYVVVDRGQGGMKKLAEAGISAEALFTLRDLAYVLWQLNKWTGAQYRTVVEEVAAHQF